jgi:hypothetical protein
MFSTLNFQRFFIAAEDLMQQSERSRSNRYDASQTHPSLRALTPAQVSKLEPIAVLKSLTGKHCFTKIVAFTSHCGKQHSAQEPNFASIVDDAVAAAKEADRKYVLLVHTEVTSPHLRWRNPLSIAFNKVSRFFRKAVGAVEEFDVCLPVQLIRSDGSSSNQRDINVCIKVIPVIIMHSLADNTDIAKALVAKYRLTQSLLQPQHNHKQQAPSILSSLAYIVDDSDNGSVDIQQLGSSINAVINRDVVADAIDYEREHSSELLDALAAAGWNTNKYSFGTQKFVVMRSQGYLLNVISVYLWKHSGCQLIYLGIQDYLIHEKYSCLTIAAPYPTITDAEYLCFIQPSSLTLSCTRATDIDNSTSWFSIGNYFCP